MISREPKRTKIGKSLSPIVSAVNLELIRCPHCHVARPNMSVKNAYDFSKNGTYKIGVTYVCTSCGSAVVAESWQWEQPATKIYPMIEKLSETIPETARILLQEAFDTLGSPNTSIVASNSSIDIMLLEKGYKDEQLYDRIKKALADGLITKEMSEWAHKIRYESNISRHPKLDMQLASSEEAEMAAAFARTLADYFYVMPNEIKKWQGRKKT